ncbi:MAG: hypothetical protein JKY43_11520 [Phycisphaerales bacterium]|nr:hypothetical protein [Phycisphaerales bacterium]
MKTSKPVWYSFAILAALTTLTTAAQPLDTKKTDTTTHHKILLADDTIKPTMTVRWMTKNGPRELSAQMPYGPPTGGVILQSNNSNQNHKDAQSNIRAYLALGGSRVDTGAGHPKGLVIRAGLTKVENAKPFFAKIVPGSHVEIELQGVTLSEPIQYHQGTGIMHLKYAIGDLLACSLPGTARNQYLLSDPKDSLGGRVVPGENATPGALQGTNKSDGSFNITVNPNDPTTMGYIVKIPYGYFRHLQDPWNSTLPGTFFEPIHLHAEAEIIPLWATPLDREWIIENNEPPENSSNPDEPNEPTDQQTNDHDD